MTTVCKYEDQWYMYIIYYISYMVYGDTNQIMVFDNRYSRSISYYLQMPYFSQSLFTDPPLKWLSSVKVASCGMLLVR